MAPEDQKSEIARLDYEALKAETSERMKIQADLAHSALRGLMLVNGGAIVALFTFIGNSNASFDRSLIWWAFGFFATGLILTLAANISGFLAQTHFFLQTNLQSWNAQLEMLGGEAKYEHIPFYKRGMIYQRGGVASAVCALVAFIVGCGFALGGVLVSSPAKAPATKKAVAVAAPASTESQVKQPATR
ncbi:MAG TPA: hypothetical protein VGB70_06700 [Allosphingosinicella sp.]|jgi:hypothetical protein